MTCKMPPFTVPQGVGRPANVPSGVSDGAAKVAELTIHFRCSGPSVQETKRSNAARGRFPGSRHGTDQAKPVGGGKAGYEIPG